MGGVIWRVEGRDALDVEEMEETNERCEMLGARRGDFRGISGVRDRGQRSAEHSSLGLICISMIGDWGGVVSKRAVISTVCSGLAVKSSSSSGHVLRLGVI